MGERLVTAHERLRNACTHAWRIGILCSLLVFGLLAFALAMPPHPEKFKEHRLAGEPLPYFLQHRIEFLEGQQQALARTAGVQTAEYSGQFRTLAILIRFTDRNNLVAPEDFDNLLFVNQQGSLRHYYRENSYGQFDVVSANLPSSLGWITAPQTYDYYCNNSNGTGSYPQNTQRLCEDVVSAVNPLVDFSQYDNNGDGYVDGLILIHTGRGAEFTQLDSDIWSHMWATPTPVSVDGVQVWKYNIQPEYWISPGDMTCGVYCHEFGHILGLPDLYDTDWPSDSYGIGNWSIMSYGSWCGPSGMGGSPAHFDAWSRIQLGFATPVNVANSMTGVSIASVESGGTIYRLWSDGASGNEYYLIENRQRTGYDSYLSSDGLLIWHIDENQSDNDNEWYPGHTSTGHYRVALEQADGLFELEKKLSVGDAGDPFPGNINNTSFTPTTVPNTMAYSGENTGAAVTNISSSAPVMTMDFQVSLVSGEEEEMVDLVPAHIELGQNYPNPFNPRTRIDFNLPKPACARLEIYDILGRPVRTMLDGRFLSGTISIEWDGCDQDGNRLPSGIYLYKLQTASETATKKMMLVK
ncbi:MAG: M6 family metalloprotease domain-containing protein [Candidatus Zixiibacteriota bacterium]|nr:MAG: M6 family metalloprotease domain-containing protein [candidate division Zixibacteria bacterium]